jgi:hypothetical protein
LIPSDISFENRFACPTTRSSYRAAGGSVAAIDHD